MTGNRLKAAATASRAFHSIDAMRDWCWERNCRARDIGWARWLYVRQDKETGAASIQERTGADAMDVVKVVRGWYPDFMNWPADKLESEFRILRHMARMGMSEEKYQSIRFARLPHGTA